MLEEAIMDPAAHLLEKATCEIEMIKALGNILPGIIAIHDLIEKRNVYMNSNGCDFLAKSNEELIAMGNGYFFCENFCPEESHAINEQLTNFINNYNTDEVIGYYRRIRTTCHCDYQQFYVTAKHLNSYPGLALFMAVPIIEQRRNFKSVSPIGNHTRNGTIVLERFNSLSKREKQILKLIASGYTNKRISDTLYISIYTVETHRKNIMIKLEMKTLSDLVRISDQLSM